jgi:formamidopyrimidine-DNA glycosylase
VPELPEVETIARGLHKRVSGDVIDSVWIGSKPEPLKSPAREIVRTLEGARISRVHRVGKHIVLELASSGAKARGGKKQSQQSAAKPFSTTQWVVHLGMTGRLVVAEPEHATAKHTHLVAKLSSGRELRFEDPRRFGRLSVRYEASSASDSAKLDGSHAWAGGREPLEISFEDFMQLFRGRKTLIKSALLNQKLLRGVGNIYADESLFRAGVRPRRRAARVTHDELRKLHRGLQEVLNEAIVAGGSSVSDYVDSDGDEGFFQLQHRVYGREGEPCPVCKTPIKRIVIAGRSSHYCPGCQR